MPANNKDSLALILNELISYLNEISDEDKGRARSAVENIENDLNFFLKSLTEQDKNWALANLQNSLSDKGILDWIWNSKNKASLTHFSEKFYERLINYLKT